MKKIQDPRIAQKVIEMVAAHYNTTPDTLKDGDGDRTARQAIMYILKDELGGTLRVAREAINVKSDITVYTASKSIKALLKTDTTLAEAIEKIKTEVLMIVAMPGSKSADASALRVSGSERQSISPRAKSGAIPGQSEPTSVATPSNVAQVIGNVQKAVTGVFLSSDLLQSPDPTAEVLLAKDAVVFLVWNDFPKISQAEILSAFRLNQDGLYRAIGKISVCLKEDGSKLKKKLKVARSTYSPAK